MPTPTFEHTIETWRTFRNLGCNYHAGAINRALRAGWKPEDHVDALLTMDDDLIGTTHPINFLTEAEAERYFR